MSVMHLQYNLYSICQQNKHIDRKYRDKMQGEPKQPARPRVDRHSRKISGVSIVDSSICSMGPATLGQLGNGHMHEQLKQQIVNQVIRSQTAHPAPQKKTYRKFKVFQKKSQPLQKEETEHKADQNLHKSNKTRRKTSISFQLPGILDLSDIRSQTYATTQNIIEYGMSRLRSCHNLKKGNGLPSSDLPKKINFIFKTEISKDNIDMISESESKHYSQCLWQLRNEPKQGSSKPSLFDTFNPATIRELNKLNHNFEKEEDQSAKRNKNQQETKDLARSDHIFSTLKQSKCQQCKKLIKQKQTLTDLARQLLEACKVVKEYSQKIKRQIYQETAKTQSIIQKSLKSIALQQKIRNNIQKCNSLIGNPMSVEQDAYKLDMPQIQVKQFAQILSQQIIELFESQKYPMAKTASIGKIVKNTSRNTSILECKQSAKNLSRLGSYSSANYQHRTELQADISQITQSQPEVLPARDGGGWGRTLQQEALVFKELLNISEVQLEPDPPGSAGAQFGFQWVEGGEQPVWDTMLPQLLAGDQPNSDFT